MGKRPNNTKGHTVLTKEALAAHHKTMPKSRHGHSFAPDKNPPGFHTIQDADQNQPWRDLPPPIGLPPFRMNLQAILDSSTYQQISKDRQRQLACGLEIDDELEPGRLLHRQFGRLGTLEDEVDKLRATPPLRTMIGPVGHQASGFGELAVAVDGR